VQTQSLQGLQHENDLLLRQRAGTDLETEQLKKANLEMKEELENLK